MKNSINILASWLVIMLLFFSCSKEQRLEESTEYDTELNLVVKGEQILGRATTINESLVNDIWVLQFQMNGSSTSDGVLVNKTHIASISDLAAVKLKSIQGDNMALYVVANSGNASIFTSLVNGTSLATLKSLNSAISSTLGSSLPTDQSQALPMVGQSANTTLPTKTLIPITLTRVVSKVVATINNPFSTGYPQLSVSSVQLKRVSATYTMQIINPEYGFDGSSDTKRYPSALASNFIDYTATIGNITSVASTYTWYIAPNVRGISSNTDARLKTDKTAVAGQGSFCTYIEILGTTKQLSTSSPINIRYRLYLGSNNTNNFNLNSNTTYNATIELSGFNPNDARMTVVTE